MVPYASNALSALEALCDYALYKSTFTLHYITLFSDLDPYCNHCQGAYETAAHFVGGCNRYASLR